MPHLTRPAARALELVRFVASDATSASPLAQRALDAIHLAVPFDLGAVFVVDPESLLLTRVLALRGHTRADMFDWVRDVYLVAGEPPSMQFPALLRRGGGAAAYHRDPERWLRMAPERDTAARLATEWRATNTPPGGYLRYGLRHRRRWVGALQLARVDDGSGFRPSELEFLDRAAPALGRALSERLAAASDGLPVPIPERGRVLFDDQRRVMSVSDAGAVWLTQLHDDTERGQPRTDTVPFAAQSLVSHLAASGASEGRVTTTDVNGLPVTIQGERLLCVGGNTAEPIAGFCLTVDGSTVLGVDGNSRVTDGQWRVARAVALGLTDKEIAGQLGIGVTTVHERVQALHNLLDTHSRAQLVAALHNRTT